MKTPQRFLAIPLLALLLAIPTRAAEPGRPDMPGFAFERIQQGIKDLGLSDEQKGKVKTIITKAQEELSAMKADLETMEPRERGERIREVMEGVHKDLSATLTPDQKAAFEKKWEEGRQNIRNQFAANQGKPATRPGEARGPGAGQRGPGGPGFIDRLRENLQKLDLSDDQKTKIKDVNDLRGAPNRRQQKPAHPPLSAARY